MLLQAPPALVRQPASGWTEAVNTVGSAYDRRRAISAVLRPGADPSTVEGALAAAIGISSDYDLATLLEEGVKAGVLTDRTGSAYLAAAGHIKSSYNRRRVLDAIARSSVGDQSLAGAAALAGQIPSDYDRAESLIALSHASGIGPSARRALADNATSMKSDYDRGRVLSALAKAGILTTDGR